MFERQPYILVGYFQYATAKLVTTSDKDKILMSRICAFIFANKSTILYRIIIESHVNSMAESKLGRELVAAANLGNTTRCALSMNREIGYK